MPAVPARGGGSAPPRMADRRDELPEEPATIVLRENEQGDFAKGGELETTVEPGERARVLALIRNQSGIVDNYDLRVEGIPDDWWSIFPGTVYLVPFGAGGTYEQEVEVHLHPPRTPEAEARLWELKVVADSKASRIVAASAALHLHIGAYEDTATALRPQRRRGRRKATYDVHVINKANAPVLVALDGEDPDGELQFGFNRPPQEIPPGGSVTTRCRSSRPSRSGSAAARTGSCRSPRSRARRRRSAPPRSRCPRPCWKPRARRPRRSGTGASRRRRACRACTRRASTSRSCTRRTCSSGRAASTCACRSCAARRSPGPQMGSMNARSMPGAQKLQGG